MVAAFDFFKLRWIFYLKAFSILNQNNGIAGSKNGCSFYPTLFIFQQLGLFLSLKNLLVLKVSNFAGCHVIFIVLFKFSIEIAGGYQSISLENQSILIYDLSVQLYQIILTTKKILEVSHGSTQRVLAAYPMSLLLMGAK